MQRLGILHSLAGVGPQTVKLFAKLNIFSIYDLLFHLPLRYQDRTRLQTIRSLQIGEEAVVEGVIIAITLPKKGRTKLLCEIRDNQSRLFLRFFYLKSFQLRQLKPGVRLRCYGEIKLGQKGLEIIHPEFQIIEVNQSPPIETTFTPIYPSTEGLSQYQLRKVTAQALLWMEKQTLFDEIVPPLYLPSQNYPSLKEALKYIHRPPAEACLIQLMEQKTLAQQRIIFEELLAHRLSLLKLKELLGKHTSYPFNNFTHLSVQFQHQLPFKLTSAQARVMGEINEDLTQARPMLRLIQGDVGSGKTVVAALAMLKAIENGYQAALMAPTELLAEQHYRVFKNWLAPFAIEVAYLSSHLKVSQKKIVLKKIEEGQVQVIIGTHALFQKGVNFSKLALIIMDEQHRFGVEQRVLFREKGIVTQEGKPYHPHQLMMTATPIPRTLAMSFYADLDCSTIDELPPGRTPITTHVLANSRRAEVIERVREACEQGKQAYWVCPLIEESEVLNCQAASQLQNQLQQKLVHLRVGLVHGRLSSEEKEKMMNAFQAGEIHLLVATTVIEVGVDVPNASIMVIENAERLGLSQLHQLRGRVGRGKIASYCLLLYQQPLSEPAKERLAVMRETTDGFKIAQRDLELRGPGEVLGTKQTGEMNMRIANLIRDHFLFKDVQQAALLLLRDHPEVISSLLARWFLGQEQYGEV